MAATDDFLRRGTGLLRQSRFAEADDCASAGLERSPDDGRLWELRGVARWALGDRDAARADLEAATALVVLSPLARCALADAYLWAGRAEVAGVIYRHLAEAGCPTELLPRVAAGLGRLGEDGAALAVCRELVRRRPTHHAAHFGIAFYLGRLGAPPGPVLDALGLALDLAPHVAVYRLNLAWLLAEAGRPGEARDLLLGLPPESVGCPFWLGRMLAVFERAGDEALAESCRERLAGLGR